MIDILLILTVLSLGLTVVWFPRLGFLGMVLSKFSLDLMWSRPVLFGQNAGGLLTLVGLTAGLYWALKHRNRLTSHRFFRLIVVIIMVTLLAGTWGVLNSRYVFFPLAASPIPVLHAMEWWIKIGIQIGCFVLVPMVIGGESLRTFMWCVAISTMIPCLIGLFQVVDSGYHFLFSFSSSDYSANLFQRITGGYYDSGTLASVMFVAIVSSLYVYPFIDTTFKRLAMLAYIALASIVLYYTFSRSYWLTTVAYVILYLVVSRRFLPAGLVAAGIFAIVVLIPATTKRFEHEWTFVIDPQFDNLRQMERLGAGRIWLWKDAWGHYSRLDPLSKIIGSGGSYGSHNQYIAWLLTYGILGFGVLAFFLFRLWADLRRILRVGPRSQPAILAFVLFIAVSGIANLFSQPWDNVTFGIVFWTTLGLVLSQSATDEYPAHH